jgi:hypothetical protein
MTPTPLKHALILLGSVLSFACQEARKLDNIEGSSRRTESQTEDLNRTAKKQLTDLNSNTEAVDKKLEELNSEVERLKALLALASDDLEKTRLELSILSLSSQATYNDLRKAQTATLRANFWRAYLDGKSLSEKTLQAAKYFQSFESLFFKPSLESAAEQQTLLTADFQEFFGNLSAWRSDWAELKSSSFPSNDLEVAHFALALGLHLAHSTSPSKTDTAFAQLLSSLDLPSDVSSFDGAFEELTPLQKLLLRNARGVHSLLNQLSNSLGAVFVVRTSNIGAQFPWNFVEKNRLLSGKWQANTRPKTIFELEELQQNLSEATQLFARRSLAGAPRFAFGNDLKTILRNCAIEESSLGDSLLDLDDVKGVGTDSSARTKLLKDLEVSLRKLVQL